MVNKPLMGGLSDAYGKRKGEGVYLSMRHDRKTPFRKGVETAKSQGLYVPYALKYQKKK